MRNITYAENIIYTFMDEIYQRNHRRGQQQWRGQTLKKKRKEKKKKKKLF